jgi:hypothetical protein
MAKAYRLLTALPIFFLSGCATLLGLPTIESTDIPALIAEIAKSEAAVCIWIGGRGGSGSVAVTAAPIIPGVGGYGSGEILLGRVNAENTRLVIENGQCTIERGPSNVFDD